MTILRKIIERFVILSFVLIIAYLGFIIVKQEVYMTELNQETVVTQSRLDKAKQINDKLKQEKANLEKRDYIEKVAREELGMTKPGEVPYISSENK
ncbi:septum formation initiator family protein [Megamonas hypermegale]|uniref:Septum formation initiator family protein n=1 Tax=Megamonas hypermegale TaxID=158847 RepID=A0A921HMM7_9FIRM|nr:septum formation initiator family protein [Megamonas hypermegale]HJF84889.1 septum formation initiator family protein [Megamonas hypermegale]